MRSSSETAAKKVEDPSLEEYRACSICLKKNHVRVNCPDNPANRVKPAVHVVVGNLDEYESGEEDDFRQKMLVIHDQDPVVAVIESDIVLICGVTTSEADGDGSYS